jgi:hypothetical protein
VSLPLPPCSAHLFLQHKLSNNAVTENNHFFCSLFCGPGTPEGFARWLISDLPGIAVLSGVSALLMLSDTQYFLISFLSWGISLSRVSPTGLGFSQDIILRVVTFLTWEQGPKKQQVEETRQAGHYDWNWPGGSAS